MRYSIRKPPTQRGVIYEVSSLMTKSMQSENSIGAYFAQIVTIDARSGTVVYIKDMAIQPFKKELTKRGKDKIVESAKDLDQPASKAPSPSNGVDMSNEC